MAVPAANPWARGRSRVRRLIAPGQGVDLAIGRFTVTSRPDLGARRSRSLLMPRSQARPVALACLDQVASKVWSEVMSPLAMMATSMPRTAGGPFGSPNLHGSAAAVPDRT
jgi:hypothetical protein